MEPAIHDLTRELDVPARLPIVEPVSEPEVSVEVQAEAEVVDDLLLDPWFWKSEAEIDQIEDDPTAKVVEIKIGNYEDDYGTAFDARRWAF